VAHSGVSRGIAIRGPLYRGTEQIITFANRQPPQKNLPCEPLDCSRSASLSGVQSSLERFAALWIPLSGSYAVV
jgi:hypothetical protein